MTYAQYNDEYIINGVFGDSLGRFLDIGAFDGEHLSNTRALALRGWSGVLAEPSPWVFPKLYDLYKDSPSITLINAAVSDSRGLKPFWPDTTGQQYGSTLSIAWAEQSHIKGARPYGVQAIEISALLRYFGPFDFVSIDTEGHDADLLLGSNWPGVKLLCFEHSTNPPNLKTALDQMQSLGFKVHGTTPTNTYLLQVKS